MLYDVALDHVKRQPWNASDNPAIVLGTTEFQSAAIRFYKRQGFFVVSSLKINILSFILSFTVHLLLLPL